MPELPDLIHLEKRLSPLLTGQRIAGVGVKEPIVIRMLLPGDFAAELSGAEFAGIRRHGPFLVFTLCGERELVIHPMLAGRFQWTKPGEKTSTGLALSLECEPADGTTARRYLHYLDDKKMGKVYLTRRGRYGQIPKFDEQGPNLLSPEFTLEYFPGANKKNPQAGSRFDHGSSGGKLHRQCVCGRDSVLRRHSPEIALMAKLFSLQFLCRCKIPANEVAKKICVA